MKTITFDFKDSSDPLKYEAMMGQLRLLDIGLLVNNVGTSDINLLHNQSHQQITDIVTVNCLSMALLSSDVLALMKDRPHKSALINLSSYMEEKALPCLSLYAATKAFNKILTEGLWHEYPHIDILCLKPLFVETPLSRQKQGLGIPSRCEYVRGALRELRW